jgi:hypothetical protein
MPAVLQADLAASDSSVRASLLAQRHSVLLKSVQPERVEVSMPLRAAL